MNKISIFCINDIIDEYIYKIKNLYNDGYQVIFYFDKENNDNTIKNLKYINSINFYICNFCKYSKPFTTILDQYFFGIVFDENSFICGNSELDYKFALNCKLKYIPYENFFYGEQKNYPTLFYPIISHSCCKNYNLQLVPKQKDMIILVGYQGSGKSTLANYIKKTYNYEILSIDDYILNNNMLLLSKIEKFIQNNANIVIDYFCLKPIRKKFINLGKKYGFHIRVIILNYDIDIMKHNSYYRFLKYNREISSVFYDVQFDLSCNKEEGIDEIITINELFEVDDNKYYTYMF